MAESDGDRVAAFLARYCVHVKGRWAQNTEPLVVEDWQRDFLREAFEVGADGHRIYTEILLGIPRKNGKSALSAGLGHYLLTSDGEHGAEIISAAGSRDQARVVHDVARTMAKKSPRLAKLTKVLRSEIQGPRESTWKVVSSSADLQQGSNPHGSIIDEYHVHKSDALYNALAAGVGARENPMLLTITTAGANLGSPLGQLYTQALRLPDVERPSPFLTIARDRDAGFLMYWFGLPDDYDGEIDSDDVLNGCNPASWITPEFLRKQLAKPSMRETDFRRYHLNQWVQDDGDGITPEMWDACYSPDAVIPDGARAWSATDLAFTGDWAAHVIAAEVDGRIVLEGMGWAPPDDKSMEIDIRATVDGYAMSVAQRLQMQQMAFDDWNARLLMQDVASRGLPTMTWSMKASFMCPASQTFLEAVKTRRIAHNGDPILRQHVLNMRGRDVAGGWKFDKHPANDDPTGAWKTDVGLCAVAAVSMAAGNQVNALEAFGFFVDLDD